jgi:hypothetical protein
VCNGAVGATGLQGPAGVAGATGPQGSQGPIGLTGATGPAGPTGATGLTGPQGPAGPAGVQGPQGVAGTNGTNGQNTLAKTTTEAAGSNCTTGGIKIEYGLDANNNGTLDVSEINATLTKYVCNGAVGAMGATGAQGIQGIQGVAGTSGTNGVDGKNTLAKTTTEAAGANCTTGGVKIEYGLDANNNGTLDAGEINATLTKYVCNGAVGATGPAGPTGAIGLTGPQGPAGANGAQGPQGVAGTNGLNALIKTTSEPAGANCSNGGTKIETGLDANGNGVLDASEVNGSQTQFVCDGQNNSSSIGGNGFNYFFPDNVNSAIKVSHTIINFVSSNGSLPDIYSITPYVVPSGKNLYLTSITYGYQEPCGNGGFKANGVTLINHGCFSTMPPYTIRTPFIVGENMTITALLGAENPCSTGCGAMGSFTGILVDKSVPVILQTTSYVVPNGFLFIQVGTNTFPTVYTAGQTVPANTNGYIIPN